ncbi:MAG: MarR family transcriptional regulator [Patescibacteria group bacterium]|nr:MarR family transcriptional regulator [Patescibacteria group bacterium]
MNIPTYLSGALFMKAYRLLRSNVTGCLSNYDINPTSWVLMGIIRETKDGVRLVEVANTMNVKAPLVTTLVQDLIAKDLIELLPHHTDKRVKLLMLTSTGKVFMKKVESALEKSLSGILAGTTPADLAGFEAVLEAIINNSTDDLKVTV